MDAGIYVVIVHEDELSEAILRRLLEYSDRQFIVSHSILARGFGRIKRDVGNYKTACKAVPHIVLTDLDQMTCPPALLTAWHVVNRPAELMFHVAVREVESWLMADMEGLSAFLGIARRFFQANPDSLENPKQALINAARRSRYRRMASEIVPIPGSSASQGVLYNHHLVRFVKTHWDIPAAANRSPSLDRILIRLQHFMKAT